VKINISLLSSTKTKFVTGFDTSMMNTDYLQHIPTKTINFRCDRLEQVF
jgi:hypothetical protein